MMWKWGRGSRRGDGCSIELLDNGVSIELEALFFLPLPRVKWSMLWIVGDKKGTQITRRGNLIRGF